MKMTCCCNCGMEFGMSNTFYEERLADGKTFWCPAGHSQYFTRKERREQELERKLASKERVIRRMLDQLHDANRRLEDMRKKSCPFCGERYLSLGQHISRAHPQSWPTWREARDAARQAEEQVN